MVSRGAEKLKYLTLGAQWDRCVVPIYEAAARGRCVPLLKTLLYNRCQNECKYCGFRSGMGHVEEAWKPEELVRVTMQLFWEGKIQGLFLSSSVFKDPDRTVEEELKVVKMLRNMGYPGYIHLRLMPGVSKYLIEEAVPLVDRLGVNLEAPTKNIFNELCPDKGGFNEAVLKRLKWIVDASKRLMKEAGKYGFARAGVDTQFIVGAIEDNDRQYLRISEWLYKKLGLCRVYFSGFEPVSGTPLEGRKPCLPFREYRLYQSSFLIRDYGFKLKDFAEIMTDDGFLPNVDPKIAYAKINSHLFPINLNTAVRTELMKIPYIGPSRAELILRMRKRMLIDHLHDLESILGRNLARRVAPYVELKDKKLTEILKE